MNQLLHTALLLCGHRADSEKLKLPDSSHNTYIENMNEIEC